MYVDLLASHSFEFILTDPEPTDIVEQKAKELGVPLCTTEWLIQCLICQKVLSPDEDDSFTV
jgi:hypothetical protein